MRHLRAITVDDGKACQTVRRAGNIQSNLLKQLVWVNRLGGLSIRKIGEKMTVKIASRESQ